MITKEQLGENEKLEVFQEDYKSITKEIKIDLTTGEYKREKDSNR